ncbi:MAG: dinitrogenase iron-molybdenum cofactor biosynthesis protein [Desulfobacteraceae bacterium]|nr:dinitrogenase iron-molybdenum cofactor biosynthesis protein [Desulfobacteraceae bacterium]
MKVAVSASGTTMESMVDPRFGRCPYFIVAETDTMSMEAFPNENARLQGGAGIQAARFLSDKGAEVVLTGRCGPNAALALESAGVRLYEGQREMSVRSVIEKFKSGNLATSYGDLSQLPMDDYCAVGTARGFGKGGRRRCIGSEAGQGQQGSGRGQQGSGRGQQGAGRGQQGAGQGQQSSGRGQQGAGRGQQGAGRGQQGAGRGQQGAGRGQQGSGRGQQGSGRGQ